MLEPQLQRRDRAGWRARAFVLALTGDAAGASQAVQAVDARRQAEAMGPFLARLPRSALPSGRMAVHFGRFPKRRPDRPPAGAIDALAEPVAHDRRRAARSCAAGPLGQRVQRAQAEAGRAASAPVIAARRAVRRRRLPGPSAPDRRAPSLPPRREPSAACRRRRSPLARSRSPQPPSAAAATRPILRLRERASLADVDSRRPVIAAVRVAPIRPRMLRRAGQLPKPRPAAQPAVAEARRRDESAGPQPPERKPEPAEAAGAEPHLGPARRRADKSACPREFARLKAKAPKLLAASGLDGAPRRDQSAAGRSVQDRARGAGFVNELAKVDDRQLSPGPAKPARRSSKLPRQVSASGPVRRAIRRARAAGSIREAGGATRGPRDAFQRDRDRIIHSIPFRRLRHKTQVFVAPDGDHFRVRLTHSLEVAQIGRTIARALGLNEDLTEALCLAHDIGHPPFGHAGEDALQAAMAEAGGFDHNAHTLRLLTRLETPYPRHRRPQPQLGDAGGAGQA